MLSLKRKKRLFSLVFALLLPPALAGSGADDDYDRLDGHGASGKRLDVIEWEGNLEIHVYPAKSLAGLSLKLDKGRGGSKVMVIGYRFENAPKTTLVRRAVLAIPLREPFRAYHENLGDYEKITITNHSLSLGGATGMKEFTLDPPPAQLYPEGHPALAAPPAPAGTGAKPSEASPEPRADPEAVREFSW